MNRQKPADNVSSWLPAILISTVVSLVYLPCLNAGFVWDDEYNLLENPFFRGLSLSHLAWMFTTFHDANYHPLCWLSFSIDYSIWGLNPFGYHLTNLILHCLNAAAFYFFLRILLRHSQSENLTPGDPALMVSCLIGTFFFALHPLRVESVVWISTRGDLLCGLFILLTIMAYIRQASDSSPTKRLWYGFSLAAFFLSLLSRAWGITLPLALLVLDIYPLRRFKMGKGTEPSTDRLLLEKVPYFLLAAGAAVLAILAKSGSMMEAARHGATERIMQAAYGLVFYPAKTLVPVRLSPLYLLHEPVDPGSIANASSAAAVVVLTAFLWVMRRRWPWAITAWTLYVMTVSPLLGLVQSGPQLVADRYTYLSTLPFAALVGAWDLRRTGADPARRSFRRAGAAARLGIWTILLLFSVLTLNQIRIWQNPVTFWSHVARLDPDNHIALLSLGTYYKDSLRAPAKALTYFNRAIEAKPDFFMTYYNRAQARDGLGDADSAIEDYTSVIELQPKHDRAYNNRGVLRQGRGDLTGAMADYNAALNINPRLWSAYINRAGLRARLGDLDSAEKDYLRALELAPLDWPGTDRVKQVLADLRERRIAAKKTLSPPGRHGGKH
ncbi:MAG: tetratricopeptide repeat protein [Desulfobacterales bacterium]|nr:tetratricopeptide repeat protein [Desulfobacterales bacterium]